MGHNEHCHQEEHEENKQVLLLRIFLSGIFFIGGFFYVPLFILAYILVGYDIILKALKNIFKGDFFDENFLMSIATFGALCIKEFPEAVAVMFLYQIGEYLQDKITDSSKKSISDLMNIKPDFINIIDEKNTITKILPKEAKVGDIAIVNSGEKIPLDGIVLEGSANINTAPITGESLPKMVNVGDSVISGCINLDGVIKFRIEKAYAQSTVSKILELIEHAQDKKTKTEKFITKFAKIYTPLVVLGAILLIVFGIFVFHLQPTEAVRRALTFLVISCPCALVISIPLSFFVGIGKASAMGILIKGSSYVETLTRVKNVVLDKTGTLTKGKFEVVEINSENDDILRLTAFAESASNHPIALAIKEKYGQDIPANMSIKEVSGGGVIASVAEGEIRVGNAKFVGVEQVVKNGTVVYVSLNGNYIGNIVVSDTVKEESKSAIDELKKLKIHTTMLTGDSKNIAISVKEFLGLDDVYFEQTPQDKVENLEKIMQNSTGATLFGGDGINDAPVIMRADVGVAMGALGSDSAIEASDIVIMNDNPRNIVKAIYIAKNTLRIAKQNIALAIGIKVLFLVLSGIGSMSMWGAVFADVGVTVLAVMNSMRIK
jgi:Cd2+/Zn2+-exporting ATPase